MDRWIEDKNLSLDWMDGLKMKNFLKVGWMDWRWKSSSRLDGQFKNVQHFISRWKIHWEIHQDIYQIRWLDGQFKNVQHFISRWIIHWEIHHDIVGTVFWDTPYIVCPSCNAGHIWLFVKTFSETLPCIKLSSSVCTQGWGQLYCNNKDEFIYSLLNSSTQLNLNSTSTPITELGTTQLKLVFGFC